MLAGSETILSHNGLLNNGLHELRGDETYVRVECIDRYGRTAWTNPLWF